MLAWLSGGPRLGTERFAYIAQLAFMHELNDLRLTRDFVQQLRERLADLLKLLVAMEDDETRRGIDSLSSEEFHAYLSLRMGILSLQSKLNWCDECLAHIDRRIAQSGA